MSNEARRTALWDAFWNMRSGAEYARCATVAIDLGSTGEFYEECARKNIEEAANAFGYDLVKRVAKVEEAA